MKTMEVHIMKKTFALLLCLALLAAVFPVPSLPAAAGTSGDYKYWIADSTAKACGITKYTGSGGDVVIPSTLDDYTVTEIGSSAFEDCTSLTSVTIPDSVKTIGLHAFYGCKSLASVTIGNSVTYIGSSAFSDCTSLTSVTIPDSVTKIDRIAFADCTSLTSVTIGNGVTSIGDWAFQNCTSLTSVTIPDSVTEISDYAFRGCTSLTSVTIGNGVTTIGYEAFNGCTSLTSVTIGDSVTTIGDHTFYGCTSLTSVIIPDSVTKIGEGAFSGCKSLTRAIIGNSVTSIGSSAFSHCSSLTRVIIPDSVTSIGGDLYSGGAFYGCTSLMDVTIGNSVTEIGGGAFEYCESLTSVTIPDSVTTIGDSAFEGCTSLASVTIGNGVTTIGYEAFNGCTSLTSVTIGNSVTEIGDFAFASCDNLQYNIYDNAKYLGNETNPYVVLMKAENQEITACEIYSNTKVIYDYAFRYCRSLTSITIPNSVTEIGYEAFYGCASLTSVTIPESVTKIGEDAFEYCGSLTAIDVDPANTAYASHEGVLYNKEMTEMVKCPEGKAGSYTIPDSVTEIGSYAFYKCTSLTSVTIGNGVTEIGSWAFDGCTSLTAINVDPANTAYASHEGVLYNKKMTRMVKCPKCKTGSYTVPEGVTYIYFSGCTSLTSVTIPSSVKTIGNYAFCQCTSLTSVTIPDSVTSIGDNAFYDCRSLTSVTIPDSVTKIGNEAFWGCTSLTSVTIPDSMATIGSEAFENCTSLTAINVDTANTAFASHEGVLYNKEMTEMVKCPEGKAGAYTVPEGVTSIDFGGCASLTSVTIPNSVTEISEDAFAWCESLTSVTIPNSVTEIGKYAFSGCKSLTAINVDTANTAYASHEGVLYNKEMTEMVKCPQGKAGAYTVPESVTSIDFGDCTSLTSVTIGNSVTTIGNYAFSGCTSLTNVTIGNSVTEIGKYAFSGCKSLTTVTIPDSVTKIGDNAFYDCTSLTSVTIPDSVTEIGEDAFAWCESLTSVTIPNGVTSIGEYTFYDCKSLTSVTIPDSVTEISDNAFRGCTSLTSVTIGNGVTEIGEDAFEYCWSLWHVLYTDSEEQWNNISIGSGNEYLTECTRHYNCTGNEIQTEVVEPTCTERGYAVYKCSACESTDVVYTADPLGHEFGEDGVCTRCGMHKDDCLESEHPYANGADETRTLTKPRAQSVAVTFCNDTYVESGYDCIEIYDAADNRVGRFTGSELAGRRVVVPGDTVKIRLTSDDSCTYFGYALSKVEAKAFTTYSVTLTDNGDGTATITATIPANVASGKIVITPSENLTYIAGSLDGEVPNATPNENFNRGGVTGQCVAFATNEAIPEGTVAFTANYTIKEGAELSEADIICDLWNLGDPDLNLLGAEKYGDVVRVYVPPCEFYPTYAVKVENGSADKAEAEAGETVTITADAPVEGFRFDKWTVVSGGAALADPTSAVTTFVMPAGDVKVRAEYAPDEAFRLAENQTVADYNIVKSADGQYVISDNELSVGEFVSKALAVGGCTLKAADGGVVEDTDLLATGMTLESADGRRAAIVVRGDVSGDGAVDNLDAAFALQHDAGLTEVTGPFALAGDVSIDGEVDNLDAALVLQYDAGLIEGF